MDRPRTAIIVFAHGSALAEANRKVAALAEEIARLAGCPAGCAFLDVAQPDLAATVAQFAAAGAERIVVAPYFLTMGVHVSEDLPRLIAQQQARFPGLEILAAQPLEDSPAMPGLILDRVREVLQGRS